MKYIKTPYFHVGRASDLSGTDRLVYRLLEIFPGALSWATILLVFIFSFYNPVLAAYFIIAFDLYWLLKTVYLSIHLRYNWKRLKHNMSVDWQAMIANLKYEHLVHMVILPFYTESFEVVDNSMQSLLSARVDRSKMIVVLASEEKSGVKGSEIAQKIKEKYSHLFKDFLVTSHPAGVVGEMAGKGSNITYAAKQAKEKILDPQKIPYENVIVSAFDIDTVVYPDYFLCVVWHFLTNENPHRASFQPVPLYNNNIWDAPAFSRVMAVSSTFWQMIQQERPEKLATFSSHSVSFKALYEVGYWQKNMVSEDSRIYWNLFLAHDGDYVVVPISYPVSMDANLAPTFWQTVKNIYKQHRRWTWGVENIPYILFGFIKNNRISLWKKIKVSVVQVEGFWSLATNPLLIFLLGWVPLWLGGNEFNRTVLSYNLPIITRNLMIVSMLGLIISAVICISLLPPRPKKYGKWRFVNMVLQWVLIPITITVFGAIPGLDAQTRLMLGKYMGFWITPKHRK